MSYRKDFKKNPRAFMNDNIVASPDNPAHLPASKIVKITIEKNSFAVISNKPNGSVYSIIFKDTSDSISVYWCPYKPNGVGSAMLGNKADYVFTVSMNACSFGIGSYSAPWVVRVAHANAGNASNSYGVSSVDDIVPAIELQRKIQRHQLYSKDSTSKIIAYDNYMKKSDGGFDSKCRATTFGERHPKNGSWKFYTLEYVSGGTMVHNGVIEQ
jgi:hypothetical protein